MYFFFFIDLFIRYAHRKKSVLRGLHPDVNFDTGSIHSFMWCDCVDVLLCGCCVDVMWVLYGYCVGVVWVLCGCVVAPSSSCTCSVRGLRDGC